MSFTLYQTGMLPGLPDKLVIEQDNITIEDFLKYLSGHYGQGILEKILDGNGNISEGLLIALSGKIIPYEKILTTVIPPGEQVLFSVMIAGG